MDGRDDVGCDWWPSFLAAIARAFSELATSLVGVTGAVALIPNWPVAPAPTQLPPRRRRGLRDVDACTGNGGSGERWRRRRPCTGRGGAEMTRRCSHCSNNGHNSRTCPARGGGVRLFGVRLMEGTGTMKKSASMGCLSSSSASAALSSLAGGALGDHHYSTVASPAAGYASDDPAHASCSSNCRSERKKGVPWTENEHRMFLMGLQKLGKGDWRGIARNFVVSRTPTQVASHAQKYFIRRSNASRRKRHSSLFDIVPEMPIDEAPNLEEQLLPHSPNELESTSQLPTLHLGLQGPEPAESSTTMHAAQLIESIPRIHNNHPVPMLLPTYYPTFIPVPGPFWPSNQITTAKEERMRETHKIVMPTPVVPKEPVNADEVVSMSKLSIGEGLPHHMEPSALSLRSSGTSSNSRQSAFHIDSSIAVPDLNQTNSSPIHAV